MPECHWLPYWQHLESISWGQRGIWTRYSDFQSQAAASARQRKVPKLAECNAQGLAHRIFVALILKTYVIDLISRRTQLNVL